MARHKISTGIDIGTATIRVVVSEYVDTHKPPVIVGTGMADSRGLRHGYVVNHAEAVESIKEAIARAEKSSGLSIKKAFVSIGGLSLESVTATGSVFIARADNEVTEVDVKNATETAEENLKEFPNKQVLHSIPIAFKLDGEDVLGRPVGMKGARLEVETLFVLSLTQHLNDFIQTVEEAGVQVEDILASPIAASFTTLTKRQKTAGCVLANIGAETLSIVVFENNIPVSMKVFPIGGVDITHDIALGLKVPLEEAESVKLGKRIGTYPKKKLEDIIEARLSDIFELIESHLKAIGKNALLPAGIIITGGTSSINRIEELAKESLSLPAKVAAPDFTLTTRNQVIDGAWAVAYGLCVMGLSSDDEESVGIRMARKTRGNLLAWIKQFLP